MLQLLPSLGMETTRKLVNSGIDVSALGFGCWAIGGEWTDSEGRPPGWGRVDDEESVRAVRRAIDLGVTFFDTADTYGTGHSEHILNRALAGRRDDVVIATEWGNTFDAERRVLTGNDASPAHARRALTASLRRLGTDHVDLYQLHIADADPEHAAELRDLCEEFVREGLVRASGWSTDDPDRAADLRRGETLRGRPAPSQRPAGRRAHPGFPDGGAGRGERRGTGAEPPHRPGDGRGRRPPGYRRPLRAGEGSPGGRSGPQDEAGPAAPALSRAPGDVSGPLSCRYSSEISRGPNGQTFS